MLDDISYSSSSVIFAYILSIYHHFIEERGREDQFYSLLDDKCNFLRDSAALFGLQGYCVLTSKQALPFTTLYCMAHGRQVAKQSPSQVCVLLLKYENVAPTTRIDRVLI